MKKNLAYLLIIVLFIPGLLFAKVINVDLAKTVAKNIYLERINQIKEVLTSDIVLNHVYTEYENTDPVYYVFNVNQNDGFIIISADDIAKPLIGYSFEGNYDINNLPLQFSFFMDTKTEEIAFARENNIKADVDIEKAWTDALNINKGNYKEIKTVTPLLLSNWGQSGYYNDMCPLDGTDETVVGCVALAMGMVMKFYNHPAVGQGSYSYSYPSGWPTYWPFGTLSANFGTTQYNWSGIPFEANQPNDNVAKMLFHCGVAVDMWYGVDGSSSQSHLIKDALQDYFRYNASYASKSSYSTTNWINLLKNEIDNKRPMVYSGGSSSGSGHAWNCDGYQGTDFHMNWGWNGAYNGYYALDNLVAGGYTFDSGFDVIYQIYPVSGYPNHCGSTLTITGKTGSFEDGSGNEEYHNNQDCFYMIQPTCGNYIEFEFDVFQLEGNDLVNAYEGNSVSAPLIATYTGNDTPAKISSTGGELLLEFITDNSGTDIGWYASYEVEYCSGIQTLTGASGTVSDGSKSCDYENSTYCRWMIEPPGATSVTIDFTDFNLSTQDTLDYITIYKDQFSTANEIIKFKSNRPPTGQVYVPSGVVAVRFSTNSFNQGEGWSFDYTSSTSGIEDKLAAINFNVYPNPVNDDATISYSLTGPSDVSLEIVNILGKQVYEDSRTQSSGSYEVKLSNMLGKIENGVYIVKLSVDSNTLTKRIICTK